MDFLASLYAVVWVWIYDQAPVLWLSFVLVGVAIRIPSNLWSLIRAPANHRRQRFIERLGELQKRLKEAADTGSSFETWRGRQNSKLLTAYTPVTGGFFTCMGACFGAIGTLVFTVVVFVAAYFVLANPETAMGPGSGLWDALCGGGSGAANSPGPVDFYGADFRVSIVDGTNAVGWVLYGTAFFGQQIITLFMSRVKLAEFVKAHYKTVLVAILPLATGFLFLPAGLTALFLVRGLQSLATSALRVVIWNSRVAKWDKKIDAELDAIAMPDSFFEPTLQELSVISRLVARAQEELGKDFREGDSPQKKVSVLESHAGLGDVRMVISPEEKGNIVQFICSTEKAVRVLKQLKLVVEAGVKALPVDVVEVQIVDTLLDGRTVASDVSLE